MCHLRTTFGVAVLAWTCGLSHGGITYDAQSRSASAMATPSGESASAHDFGVFEAHPSAQSIYGTFAWASQSSVLGGEGMFMQGASGSYGGMQYYSARANSRFDVTFTLDEPRPYRFWGGVDLETREASAECEVSLSGPGGLIYESLAPGSWDLNGIAEAGQYRLQIRIATSAAGGPVSSTASCYGGFTVPSQGAFGLVAGLGIWGIRRRR